MIVIVQHNSAKTQFEVDMVKFRQMTPNTRTNWLSVAIKQAIEMVDETANRMPPPQTNM